jgi:predicted transcriptional regulator
MDRPHALSERIAHFLEQHTPGGGIDARPVDEHAGRFVDHDQVMVAVEDDGPGTRRHGSSLPPSLVACRRFA